ncbi:uncharacterized protein LOC121393093 isoform X1 [Xenopus laevis]|uniref:Uncharacterized protein LOC121393093 isoform X1 n=1 Tax=Xenopus laevis TaxID=8355 RepID=A0A8J1M8D0_XENLA|nr:uncharacterized protein LOC121393093 isoform X1 [Xenopus laevis]
MCLLLVLLLCVLMSLPKGWAAETDPVYVALNDSVLLNIPGYPNAEKLQVTWKDGNGILMGKFKNSSSYKQRTVCECELFRNGSLYLNRLDTVGNETYKVEVFEQSGKSITTASLLVTVIEKVSAPRLNSSCSPDGLALIGCEIQGGTDPQYSWLENGVNLSSSWNVSGNWISGFAPVPVNISCCVWNPVSEEWSQLVSVFCPIPVSVPTLNVSCQRDGSARILCWTDSGTDPVFSWSLNGTDKQGSPLNQSWSQISIVPPPAEGNILCVVSNNISLERNTMNFSCPVPVSDPVLEVSCLTNGSALVSCKVESGTNPFYSLIHNGKTVYENSSSPLVNVSLPLSSPGNISCSVRNRFSTKETGVQGRYCPVAGGVAVGRIMTMAVFVLYSSLLGSMLWTLLRMRRDEGEETIYINNIVAQEGFSI